MLAHQLCRHEPDIIGRGQMAFCRQTAGVDKVGIFHAQLFGAGIHHGNKALLRACQVLPQRHGAIVGRNHRHALEHLPHRQHLALFQPDLTAAHGGGVGRGGHRVFQLDAPAVDGFAHQQQGHHLGDAGRLPGGVGILFKEHLPVRRHQERRRRPHRHHSLQGKTRHCQQTQHQQSRQPFSHIRTLQTAFCLILMRIDHQLLHFLQNWTKI